MREAQTTLEALCKRVTSGGTPSRAVPEYFGGSIPWVKTGEVKKGFIYETEECITELGLENSSAKLIPPNSLIVAMYGDGDTAGNVAVNKVPVTTNQACCNFVVDPEKADYQFLYYYLKGSYSNLVGLKLGGSQQNLNAATLKRFPVPVVPLGIQKKIAAILTAYDDLIANNQRRIALLESMAEEIYREWFVRMRFPGKTANAPESIEPAGWHRKALGELTCLLKRGVSPNYDEKVTAVVVNQKCIRNGRLDLADARLHDTPTPDEKLLRYGDVLINSTGVGTLGRAAVFDLDRENITCDSHVTIARPRDVQGEGEFLSFTVQLLQSYFEAMASGSTGQAELGRDFIAKTKVLVPAHELLRAFSERVRPMRKQRRLLMDANEQLVGMRDALLPRLISGKLRVDQLDIQFPPSMRAETAEAAP